MKIKSSFISFVFLYLFRNPKLVVEIDMEAAQISVGKDFNLLMNQLTIGVKISAINAIRVISIVNSLMLLYI